MPYIPPATRKLSRTCPLTDGELNYAISMLVQEWMQRTGGLSYRTINAAIGVLECAKLELYSELARPYEEEKKRENGDVYFLRPTPPNQVQV